MTGSGSSNRKLKVSSTRVVTTRVVYYLIIRIFASAACMRMGSLRVGEGVSLSRISLVVSDCVQHTVASWMYCAINEQHSAVGRSLSLDQPSGTRFQMS